MENNNDLLLVEESPEEDALYLIEESTLTDIADAIREKTGISGMLDPANFASEILSIGQAPTTPTLISFTIDGTTYLAKAGMTWAEWVADTTLNTGGYISMMLSGVTVATRMISAIYGYGVAYDDAYVPITDTIVSGRAYSEKYGNHSDGAG